jgi:hypothetical protein
VLPGKMGSWKSDAPVVNILLEEDVAVGLCERRNGDNEVVFHRENVEVGDLY